MSTPTPAPQRSYPMQPTQQATSPDCITIVTVIWAAFAINHTLKERRKW